MDGPRAQQCEAAETGRGIKPSLKALFGLIFALQAVCARWMALLRLETCCRLAAVRGSRRWPSAGGIVNRCAKSHQVS